MLISLGLAQVSEELAGVFVTVVDADAAAVNADIKADTEILRHEGGHTVWLDNLVTLKESAHGHTSVDNLGFSHQNALVLKEVVDV